MSRVAVLLGVALLLPLTGESADRPSTLDIFVGGFDRPSYRLLLTNGVLNYTSGGGARSPSDIVGQTTEVVKPSETQWQAFKTSVEEIGVWTWKTNYTDLNVLDGTGWHVYLKWNARAVASEGGNAYPEGKDPEPSRAFQKLMAAVRTLLSGKAFH